MMENMMDIVDHQKDNKGSHNLGFTRTEQDGEQGLWKVTSSYTVSWRKRDSM